MAMVAGSASSDGQGGINGTGLAVELARARMANMIAALSGIPLPQESLVRIASNVARDATSDAGIIVAYLKANAVAKITNQSLGVTTTTGQPIDPPAAPVSVPIE